jgi:MinD superfamily P-loop ATPase
MPGLDIRVTDRCAACGACAEGICFVDAIRVVNGRARISGECRGCGLCVGICPNDAIELRIKDDRFFDRSIEKIGSLVDLT